MPATKRPMKIYLSLPRPSSRLSNGAWTDSGPAVGRQPPTSGAPTLRLPVADNQCSQAALRHRARCDTPVITAGQSRPWWPQLSGQRVVTRRDQNCQTVEGGKAVPPPIRDACPTKKAVGRTLSFGTLGQGGGGSLPNISQIRKAK